MGAAARGPLQHEGRFRRGKSTKADVFRLEKQSARLDQRAGTEPMLPPRRGHHEAVKTCFADAWLLVTSATARPCTGKFFASDPRLGELK
mmetsp:Transcript_12893/g.30655  ORF Transcript_12893/g.30655 Transcript_12893/m.30655 type:complete len:90 (-) Transcript_12893:133-402(-)